MYATFRWWLTLTALLWPVSALSQDIPHVSQCNFCYDCIVGDAPIQQNRQLADVSGVAHGSSTDPKAAGSAPMQHPQAQDDAVSQSRKLKAKAHKRPAVDPDEDPSQPVHLRASSYAATFNDEEPKSTLPNCTQCYGCNTKLSFLTEETQFLDRTFQNEAGATSNWLFRATTNRTASGMAVVKIYCVPISKTGAKIPTCAPATILKNMKLLLAIQQLSEECGFTDIIPKLWVDRVDAIFPDVGYHIRWHALWMDFADGISLENFLHRGKPARFEPSTIIDVMQNKLNKTKVVRAAIFDLLTSQCDRHAQNIFIDETGQLTLIDNEAALQNSWKNCGFDSILVPTTQKQEIMRLSNQFVLKLVTADKAPHGVADPQVLLDYRCYIDGEELGTNYPAQIKQCLTRIASMTPEQVQHHYSLHLSLPAFNLQARATDMLSKGFEYAFKYGHPQNAKPKRYRLQPKCCQIEWKETHYECAHDWSPRFELPIGDPNTGREWQKPKPDTGTYEGGNFE